MFRSIRNFFVVPGFFFVLGLSLLALAAPMTAAAQTADRPPPAPLAPAMAPVVPAPSLASADPSALLTATGAGTSPRGLVGTAATDPENELLFGPNEALASTNPALALGTGLETSIRVFTSLSIVIGLMLGMAWIVRRRVGLGASSFGRTLAVMPLDQRRALHLVEILGRVVVLGVTEHNINLLLEIEDRGTVDALRIEAGTRAPATEAPPAGIGFLQRAREALAGQDQGEALITQRQDNAQAQLRKIEGLLLRRDTPTGPDPAGDGPVAAGPTPDAPQKTRFPS